MGEVTNAWRAREACLGSVHGERGAIPCNCEVITQALDDAEIRGAERVACPCGDTNVVYCHSCSWEGPPEKTNAED